VAVAVAAVAAVETKTRLLRPFLVCLCRGILLAGKVAAAVVAAGRVDLATAFSP
jgi:hypothetical protein